MDSTAITPSRLTPLLRPIHAFLSVESAGGIVLMIAAVAALVWANSPWGDSYGHFWHTKLAITAGGNVEKVTPTIFTPRPRPSAIPAPGRGPIGFIGRLAKTGRH